MLRNIQRTVMVIEQECSIRSAVVESVNDNGIRPLVIRDGDDAVRLAQIHRPDVTVLGIHSKYVADYCLDLCERFRALDLRIPVIFLASRVSRDKLDAGLRIAGPGSDFVILEHHFERPRSGTNGNVIYGNEISASCIDELIVRIRKILPKNKISVGEELQIDQYSRKVERLVNGSWELVSLQPMQYDLLKHLVDLDGSVVETWDLFERVFLDETGAFEDTEDYRSRVWTCMSNLRKKLDPTNPHHFIETVHGLGYRLRSQVNREV